MEKINYVITTWSGQRRCPNSIYLRDHLLKLLSLNHHISQITIVKPVFEGYDKSYYDVEKLTSKFDCKVEIIEKYDNIGQSYGQFFFSFEKFGDEFDYYIFVEDDYIPNINNFDTILVREYKDKNCGYLCSFAGIDNQYPLGGCSVSNGIISSNILDRIYKMKPHPILMIDAPHGGGCQKNFTDLILGCDLFFADFSDKYRVPYFGNQIIEYGRLDTSESIFVPHQLFDIDLNIREMEYQDLPIFLKIRNESRDFLHNNTEFTLQNVQEWFEKNSPKFFIIEFNNNIIGYFRTSNWEKESLYIGCDIDSSYRGLGLGFLSYRNFIGKIWHEFKMKKIKLEVLSNNHRAINLYKKLGFQVIGVSENKIIRDNVEIESLIMETQH